MRYGIFKIMVVRYICVVEDKVVLHNTNVWENHDFKISISHDTPVQSLLNFKEPL